MHKELELELQAAAEKSLCSECTIAQSRGLVEELVARGAEVLRVTEPRYIDHTIELLVSHREEVFYLMVESNFLSVFTKVNNKLSFVGGVPHKSTIAKWVDDLFLKIAKRRTELQ